jgi:hypothetical protein
VRKIELDHNTPEQVREYLADALAVTEELDPPEDLRVALFAKAVDLFSAKSVTIDPGSFGAVAVPGRVH